MRSKGGFVYLTAEEMAEFDRTAIEDFGIGEPVLMENAGVAVARVARLMLGRRVEGKAISFMVGKGNNGGDGLVAARHLHNWGARVSLVPAAQKSDFREVPALQLAILEKMGVTLARPDSGFASADLLVDALLGYNARGDPREPLAGMIRRANASKIRILAVDLPSGLDATTGRPGDPCVAADATVTLGLPKLGFLNPEAKRYVGELFLADLSFPGAVYRRYAQKRGLFREDSLVRIR